jgi:hypothetical protein
VDDYMGYRNYLGLMKKQKYDNLKNMKEISIAIKYGRYENDNDYHIGPYHLVTELYDFGKYVDWTTEIRNQYGKNLHFEFDESDNEFWVLSKEGFLAIIHWYINKVKKNYNETIDLKKQQEEWDYKKRLLNHNLIYDLDKDSENVNQCWLYEYATFDLIRIYKSLKEDDILFIYGY